MIVTDRAEIAGRRGGDPAVIRIGGSDGPADVRLPEDCTPRELALACELLAEIVRLRRRGRCAAQIRQELSAQALSDPLTGLPNRRAWDLALKERAAAAAEAPNQLCLAILDLDHFKQINDLHGHAVGDEVLKASGRTISDHLRQDDFVARFGGDEFGLLLWVPDDETAAAILERVRTALPGEHARAGLPTRTASVGYRLAGRGGGVRPPALPRVALSGGRRRAPRGQAAGPRSHGRIRRRAGRIRNSEFGIRRVQRAVLPPTSEFRLPNLSAPVPSPQSLFSSHPRTGCRS